MGAEETPNSMRSNGGWECKPFRPKTTTFVIVAFVGGVACGSLPSLWLSGDSWIWLHTPTVLACLLVFVGILFLLLRAVLLPGRDCLYMDERRIVRIRQIGRYYKRMWAVRIRDIQDVKFTGGSFLTGPFEARIGGRCFYMGAREAWRFAARRASIITFKAGILLSHPRLLERLIELAQSKCKSVSRRKALERARQFASRATGVTPPAIASDDVEPPDVIFTALLNRIRRIKRNSQSIMLAFPCMLLAILGVTVFTHLRGSFFDIFMRIVPYGLLAGLWAWPIAWRSKYRWVQVARWVMFIAAFFFGTVFIVFFPLLWFAMAAYLILLLYRIALLRFGRATARKVWRIAAVLAAVYVAAVTVHFTNWQTGRVETVFSVRDHRLGCVPTDLTVSPDGKMLSFRMILARFPKKIRDDGEWLELKDTPLEFFRNAVELRFMDPREITTKDGLSLVFAPMDGSPTKIWAAPRMTYGRPRWSPDSQWFAVVGNIEGEKESKIFLMNPLLDSQRTIYEMPDFLYLPSDAWTTDAVLLKAIAYHKGADNTTTRSKVLINVETGGVKIEPLPAIGDIPSSSAEVSPNRQWVAVPKTESGKSAVIIAHKEDGKEVASVPIACDQLDPQLRWSPDSRRLAISRPFRTWVYDLETSRTTIVKTWRRGSIFPAEIAWAPDSKSFYFIRHMAMDFLIGIEIVRVWLRE